MCSLSGAQGVLLNAEVVCASSAGKLVTWKPVKNTFKFPFQLQLRNSGTERSGGWPEVPWPVRSRNEIMNQKNLASKFLFLSNTFSLKEGRKWEE